MSTTEPSEQTGKSASRGPKTKGFDHHSETKERASVDITELAEQVGEQMAKHTARPVNMTELAEEAKNQLAKLTGLKPVSVTGAAKDERGWSIVMEMLEMVRIPSSTDILGEYQMLLDDDGNVLSFERRRTHLRGQPIEKEK